MLINGWIIEIDNEQFIYRITIDEWLIVECTSNDKDLQFKDNFNIVLQFTD